MTADDLAFLIMGLLFLSLISAFTAPADRKPPAKPKKTPN